MKECAREKRRTADERKVVNVERSEMEQCCSRFSTCTVGPAVNEWRAGSSETEVVVN